MVDLEKTEPGIYTLKINRPKALNALSLEVLKDLDAKLDELGQEKDLRVLILTGEGEKAFVAGADIKAMQDLNAEAAEDFAKTGQRVFSRIENLNALSIAAVNGFALGGGFELALACDFIFASDNAKFGLPEVTLGLIPGFGGTQRLSRNLGLSFAKYLIASGEMQSASDLKERGLVIKVLSQEALMSEVLKTAQKVVKKTGSIAVSSSKKAIQKGFDLSLEKGLALEAKVFSELFDGEEAKEGMAAFVEKRPANF